MGCWWRWTSSMSAFRFHPDILSNSILLPDLHMSQHHVSQWRFYQHLGQDSSSLCGTVLCFSTAPSCTDINHKNSHTYFLPNVQSWAEVGVNGLRMFVYRVLERTVIHSKLFILVFLSISYRIFPETSSDMQNIVPLTSNAWRGFHCSLYVHSQETTSSLSHRSWGHIGRDQIQSLQVMEVFTEEGSSRLRLRGRELVKQEGILHTNGIVVTFKEMKVVLFQENNR